LEQLNLRPLDLLVDWHCRRTLAAIQKTASFAIVAGGYLRDRYYQVAPKDLDIFVSSDCDMTALSKALDDWSLKDGASDLKELQASDQGYRAIEVITFVKSDELPLQIIISDEFTAIDRVFKDFDFGFCQIAYTGHQVMVSDAFWRDAADNTATYLHPEQPIDGTQRRADKLRQKYPNTTWVWA